MRDVLVLADENKDEVRRFAPQIEAWLKQRVERVRVSPGEGFEHEGPLPELVIVLGGDGALLSAVRAFQEHPVPTLGINFGRVGFLASTPFSHWEEVVAGALRNEGVVEPRMRLLAQIDRKGGAFRAVALNDVVVARGTHESMMTTKLSVGDTWVTNYRADGLIVATPSGSTAYSLSAGGPILAPSMRGIVVTPMCSHTLANRPIVLHPDSELAIEVPEAVEARVVVDGRDEIGLHPGEVLRVQRHPELYPLLAMPGLDPYRRLRERLGWRGSV